MNVQIEGWAVKKKNEKTAKPLDTGDWPGFYKKSRAGVLPTVNPLVEIKPLARKRRASPVLAKFANRNRLTGTVIG